MDNELKQNMFRTENATLLSESAVFALRTYASWWWGVFRVVTGNLTYHWAPCGRPQFFFLVVKEQKRHGLPLRGLSSPVYGNTVVTAVTLASSKTGRKWPTCCTVHAQRTLHPP